MTAILDRVLTTPAAPALHVAFELGWTSWKLGFSDGPARAPRVVTVTARDLAAVEHEIAKAKRRLGLPDDAAVRSVYEAGRDGFWLHRYLVHSGYESLVVDPASIEVNRRARRAKSDGLDVAKLLSMLLRHHGGERNLWKVVNAPAAEDEDRRQPQRELIALKRERTEHSNRVKGLLASLGLDVTVDERLPERIDALRQWDGAPVPEAMRQRLLREHERWKLVDAQARDLENRQRRRIRDDGEHQVERVRRLMDLKGVGPTGAWLLVHEIFGWRKVRNRRQLAALVGLTPTPYQSGGSRREQGISKAGNRRARWIAVELAWMWLQYQPKSGLSGWYRERFGAGNSRARKVGIVALARKLLVAFWKWLEFGELPDGAELVPWRKKLNGRMPAGAKADDHGGGAFALSAV